MAWNKKKPEMSQKKKKKMSCQAATAEVLGKASNTHYQIAQFKRP